MDPLVADNWLSITTDSIFSQKGGVTILNHYGGSLIRALMDVYPDIDLDACKFDHKSQNFWQSMENRRKFLDNFASKHGFDPLNPNAWYYVSPFVLRSEKGGGSFLNMYYSSMIKALMDVYPDIGLEEAKFNPDIRKESVLRIPRIAKDFFGSFARKHGFDPLVAENWYYVSRSMLMSEKRAKAVLAPFQFSHVLGLLAVYPHIGLEKSKFRTFPKTVEFRRRFFADFSRKQSMDPLVAANWYSSKLFNRSRMTETEVGKGILRQFGGSLPQALMDAFPNIGLEKFKRKSNNKKSIPFV